MSRSAVRLRLLALLKEMEKPPGVKTPGGFFSWVVESWKKNFHGERLFWWADSTLGSNRITVGGIADFQSFDGKNGGKL